MKLLKESLVILATIATVFLISQTDASNYIIPIIIAFVILSAIYIFMRKIRKQDLFQGSYFEFFAVTSAILLLIFFTDELNSNFFFLTYFLLFGISFIF